MPWQSGSADPTHARADVSRWAAVVTTALVVTTLCGCDSAASSGGLQAPKSSATVASDDQLSRTARSIEILHAQQSALQGLHSRRYDATWAVSLSTARRQARTITANLRSLGISQVSCHVIPSTLRVQTVPRPSSSSSGSLRGWTLEVNVAWRLDGVVARNVLSSLTYTFVVDHGKTVVADISASDGAREPVWLLRGLQVRRSPRVAVVAARTADVSALFRRARVARRDVQQVLPRWHGHLFAYLPATLADFDHLLGATSGEYDDIAALTTTLDGSADPRAPVAIVVNPRVWPLLRPEGAHVVITHEATHAATGSATVDLPLWLSEGFADYVAVRAAQVPVAVAAAAALRVVRARGAPRRIPADRAFAPTNPGLESSYELSRLVMQTIARHHGRRLLVDFYRDVVAHPADLTAALRRDLHTSTAVLTRQWRRLLVRLAGAE